MGRKSIRRCFHLKARARFSANALGYPTHPFDVPSNGSTRSPHATSLGVDPRGGLSLGQNSCNTHDHLRSSAAAVSILCHTRGKGLCEHYCLIGVAKISPRARLRTVGSIDVGRPLKKKERARRPNLRQKEAYAQRSRFLKPREGAR